MPSSDNLRPPRLGRKKLPIEYAKVAELRQHPDRYTWEEIAQQLQCSRATVIRVYASGAGKEAPMTASGGVLKCTD